MLRVSSIRIQNFRSIVDETIDLSDMTVFVGCNDAGKSNILKAMNLFFNDETDFGSSFNFDVDYCRFPKRGSKQAKEITISVDFEVPWSYKEAGTKTWTKTWRADYITAYSDNVETLFEKGSRGYTLLSRTKYLYIPAIKSNEYFKSLLSQIYLTMTESANTMLRDLNNEYSEKLQDITCNLSNQLRSVLRLESAIQMPKDLNTIFRDLSFITSDNYVRGIDLNQRGDGIKARHIPSILRFMQKNMEQFKMKGAISNTFIWGFEEPENGIEFSSCFDMADELYSYQSDCQMLITTHSPIFFSKSQTHDEHSTCYFAYKNEHGASKYDANLDDVNIIDKIGFMPLIAPYVEKERVKYAEQISHVENQLKSITSMHNHTVGKIIIIPEGKTDVKYLQCAFQQLGISDEVLSRVEYYDFQDNQVLGSELSKLLTRLSKMGNTCKVVGMFDRDTTLYTSGSQPFKYYGNKVYAFNIPALSLTNRKPSDKICIEHYFTNEEIKTDVGHGRLYMGEDFDEYGKSVCGTLIIPGFSKNESMTPIRIIDSSFDKLCDLCDGAKIITKDAFANYVISHPSEFDFHNFELIFSVIKQIAEHSEPSGK